MKRIQRPQSDYAKLLNAVASNMQKKNRAELRAGVPAAMSLAANYRLPSLGSLTSSASEKRRLAFLAAYKTQVAPFDDQRAAILALVDECPYCGSADARTLDHYLEKWSIPELALFPPNLVPCCADCNPRRAPSFKGRTRQVIHFYDDDVDATPEVLSAKLDPSSLAVVFSVRKGTTLLARLYARHFVALKLAETYRSWARGKLRNLRHDLKGKPQAERARELRQLAKRRKAYRGPNHPEVALYRAVARDSGPPW